VKSKFLLMLLVFNGLLWGANSASARIVSATANNYNIAQLSLTIAESIGFTPDTHSLIELAIDRALLAQSSQLDQVTTTSPANHPPQFTSGRVTTGENNRIRGTIRNTEVPVPAVPGKESTSNSPTSAATVVDNQKPEVIGTVGNSVRVKPTDPSSSRRGR
jgi:hypothetical protein